MIGDVQSEEEPCLKPAVRVGQVSGEQRQVGEGVVWAGNGKRGRRVAAVESGEVVGREGR